MADRNNDAHLWQLIRKKQEAIMANEDEQARQKTLFEAKVDQLIEKHHRLAQAIAREEDQMHLILSRYPNGHQETQAFFSELYHFLDESNVTFRKAIQTLEEDYAHKKQQLAKEHDHLEQELYQLRRQYD